MKKHQRHPCAQRIFLFLTTTMTTLALPSIGFAQEVVVRLEVQRADHSNCDDAALSPPDIYFAVTIAGFRQDSRESAIEFYFTPFDVNYEFSHSVDISLGTIPIVIEQWDADSGIFGADDQCDISVSGDAIELDLDLTACVTNGEVTGSCGAPLSGLGPFEFTVDVEEPPSAPGLNVRCLHNPIWPQPGQTVTITANGLDGALAPRTSDAIEIWVDNQNAPAVSVAGTTATFTAGPFPGSTFTYGCRVRDDALVAWTGWRTVAVGSALGSVYGNRIPIYYTGPRSSRIDLVFYPDSDSYTGGDDPMFLGDVRTAINGAYHNQDIFLANQDAMNYWIALTTGVADGCDSEVSQTSWEDAGALLHTDNFRDCAPGGGRFFTSRPTSFGTMIHETGHRPFGLADEYCCDGGYFQADPFPNVYSNLTTCDNDAASVGNTSCRSFVEDVPWWFDTTWWTSDPASNDLMVDNRTRRNLDNRRFNWLFDICRGAGC